MWWRSFNAHHTWLTCDDNTVHMELWTLLAVSMGADDNRTRLNSLTMTENRPSSITTLIRAPSVTCWNFANVETCDMKPRSKPAVGIWAAYHLHILIVYRKQHIKVTRASLGSIHWSPAINLQSRHIGGSNMVVGHLLSLVCRHGTHCQNVYVIPLLVLQFLAVLENIPILRVLVYLAH